ncbi:hypothetical protein K493DRAFT_367116 [Basidiobolus meristosporus CBS 931.73]|uniref:Hydrophobin n=1 Tax=Basidiobolus meristosporus CBS 931.73 TaxID=1314790 RepID=A0A1Y1W2D5_9FUNG|nr:hypothetical protein K493DRAFT_367116 [Basidiobolus meristosporus CBS 931.73]|eukprot:ORX67701.1 hypothetical protein K493DRAFT_367116 [Basidiobolus meristosporus CBS 931.73]
MRFISPAILLSLVAVAWVAALPTPQAPDYDDEVVYRPGKTIPSEPYQNLKGYVPPYAPVNEPSETEHTSGDAGISPNPVPTSGQSSGRCSDIKANLIAEGLRAKAIVCIEELLVIYPFKAIDETKQQGPFPGLLSTLGGAGSNNVQAHMTCGAIRTRLEALGIQLEAEICLSGLIQIRL